MRVFLLLCAVLAHVALGLAPLYRQKETVDRTDVNGPVRSYMVIWNDDAKRFGHDRAQLISYLVDELPEVDPLQVVHMYDIGGQFCGFSVWMNQKALSAIRSHKWVKYVEEDSVVSLPDSENPALLNDTTGAPFTERPDWGQVRVEQRVWNLATTPAGLFPTTSYPSGGSDTTVWDWTQDVYNAYGFINTGALAKIWIVDTGVLFGHQEFYTTSTDTRSRVTTVVDFALNPPAAGDCNGHGTHCAGSAAGLYRGVAVGAELGSVRVLNCGGSGTTANVVAGFDFVSQNQAVGKSNILSASLGGGASQASDDSITAAAANGVIPVVAAGNNAGNACSYSPARAPAAITVGATQSSDALATFSNFGPCVDISAPGVSIHSAYYTSNSAYTTYSGTSMATPLTAGSIALYVSTFSSQPIRVGAIDSAIASSATPNSVVNPPAGTTSKFVNAGWA